jgi:hypothetical protein
MIKLRETLKGKEIFIEYLNEQILDAERLRD